MKEIVGCNWRALKLGERRRELKNFVPGTGNLKTSMVLRNFSLRQGGE
jgi:hypothetical protein